METRGGRRLNLGSGRRPIQGYINIDNSPNAKDPDVVRDITRGLPYEDSTIDEVNAQSFLEHLESKDVVFVMNEIWRVLKHGGLFSLEVPIAGTPESFQDPTHVSFWNRQRLKYFQKGSSYCESVGYLYGIVARFEILNAMEEHGYRLKAVLRAVK